MKTHALLLLLAAVLVAVASATSPPRIPLPGGPAEPDCTGNSAADRWRKDCNWCSCRNGRGSCTRRLCPQGVKDDEPPCEGNPTWKDDCNSCSCVDGRAICTSEYCGGEPGPVVVESKRSLACEEGSRWRVECNWCTCEHGRGVCTEAACIDWNEAKAIEDGVVECHGDARWKKDCNWCTCVNGRGICTTLACLPSERNPYHNLPVGATCVPGSRWLQECNWCVCNDNGNAICSLRACQPDLRHDGPTCEGDSSWRQDCNNCRCVNGTSACSKRLCPTQQAQGTTGTTQQATPQAALQPTQELQCQGEGERNRWRKDCNWCRCHNGDAACTKRLCPEGQEEGEPICEGNVSWKDGCNMCRCVNSKAICTSAFCGPLPVRPATRMVEVTRDPRPECEGEGEGDRWRQDCNWCRCRNGVGACTRRLCRTAGQDNEPECEGNVSWKKDCNRCHCANGRAICTTAFCGPIPARPAPRREPRPDCEGEEEGDRWREDCNWCRCRNGVGACTRRLCRPGEKDEGPECEGNVSWKKDCNRCHCANGRAICTTAFCGPLPARPTPRREPRPDCEGEEEGDRWREDCNWCRCRNGVGACTRRLCRPGEKDNEPECEGNVSWKKDCNRCHCVNGRAICTTAFCGDLPTPEVTVTKTPTPQCEGETGVDRWIQGCNWCTCRNGSSSCTRRGCREGEVSQPLCEGSPSWRKDCNQCHCANGRAVCTTKHCGGPLGPETSVSVEVSRARKEPVCEDGSRWRVACNWCSCHNGMAGCTEKGCLNPHALDGTPECEGNATWKRDCNWCTCGDGKAVCTRMACLKETKEVCVEGSSWREDCNMCRCSQGFVMCTKKFCIKPELPELCSLPPVTGNIQCTAFFIKWTFAKNEGACTQITYGGCSGTANLFDSKEECEEACPAPAHTSPQSRRITLVAQAASSGGERCTLPQVQGPCFGAFQRYAYNAVTGTCEQFLFGGCAGNANNFVTEEECIEACQGTQGSACDKSKCPWNLWEHYLAKECVPQYAGDACCPTSFQCPSASERGKDPTKCYYKGTEYNEGENVPVEDPCSAGCYCRAPTTPDSLAEIICANVECPELFRPPTPGCRPLYRADQCCPYDHECVEPNSPPLETRAATCDWQNKTYQEGSKMYFKDDSCQSCICGPCFTDPYGPGCRKIDCGFGFRYTARFHQGCVPIHYEGSKCCPIGWMCPDDSLIEPPQQQQQQPPVVDESAVCRLGDRTFAVGESLGLTDCKIDCRCLTPPELTCIQYRTCEAKQEAAPKKECPAVQCDAGCRLVVDGPAGCPTCSCSPDTFTCPAQTCPSTCSPDVDLETGCPTCRCQCPAEVPCPADCPVHTVLDEATGCPRCECHFAAPQTRGPCPEHPGGRVPCPMDCAVITRVDENGCEVCECDPNQTGNPFGPPSPPRDPSLCRTMPDGRAPCPMDCSIIRVTDENGCEVCKCDPNNPGHPFGPFRPRPPPPAPRDPSLCQTMPDGRAPCPMDCAIIRVTDENGCEVCKCDPNNPGHPFGPYGPPPPPPSQYQ
ncbi:kielin/chordin-like protein isoform X3 [Eriocheir sinensis]|uniref:kielin/chordin-like protein isoform X2 n=1 Tax=Eriocheir sinensis TaxID=95602 RepID=UPI0021C649E5|nr:kielin/chordin-like protein isoform X2 [Eriocheir sinensis]XP_050720167.1 kielin/chordin-like protein isoform X3 [Eriocheir sinensis]